MAYPNLANGWTSTLSAGINSTDLSCTVPATAGLPALPCKAVILALFPNGLPDTGNSDEIVTISANASGTLTIARHTEPNSAGSSAGSAHSAGVIISHVLTKVSLDAAIASAATPDVNTVASSGASQTVDIATASVWDITLTANCTLTIAGSTGLTWLSGPDVNLAASAVSVFVLTTIVGGVEKRLSVRLTQDATGGRTVTWSTSGAGTAWFGAQAGGSSGFLQAAVATRTAGDVTTISTSFVDLTGMSVTITTGAHRCLIFFTGSAKSSGDQANVAVDVTVDGTRQGQAYGIVIGSMEHTSPFSVNHNMSFQFLTAVLGAGSHTFKVQWRVDAGTGTMFASAGVSPIILTVIETGLTS